MVRWSLALALAAALGACQAMGSPRVLSTSPPAWRTQAQAPLAEELAARVREGFAQIFRTYDRQPADGHLSFLEFGKVVTWEWFDAHDANDDELLVMEEWLTAQELQAQVQGIVATGAALVAKADRNGDGRMSLPEFEAHQAFEIDPTPWLAGPPDPQVRRTFHQRFAAQGLLDGPGAARMVGALLAQGYYLDEAGARAWPRLTPPF